MIRLSVTLIIIMALSSFSHDDYRSLLRKQIFDKERLSNGVLQIKQKLPKELHYLLDNLDTTRIQVEFNNQLKVFLENNRIPKKVVSLNFVYNETQDPLINDGRFTPYFEIIGTNLTPESIDGIDSNFKTINWEKSLQWKPKKNKIILTDFNLIGLEVEKKFSIQKCECLDLVFVGMTNLLLLNSDEFSDKRKSAQNRIEVNSGDYYHGYYLIKRY